jgi:tRNA(Ile)-lysidine synthase TilS/MesJ
MKTAGFPWREDASNTLRKYKRNIVRLDLLPIMKDLAGGPGPLNKLVYYIYIYIYKYLYIYTCIYIYIYI